MDRISLIRHDPMESTMLRDCESIPAGSDIGNSGEGLQRPSNTSNGEVKGANGRVPFSLPDGDLTEYLRKEITTITANSMGELEAVWAEVGFHKSKIPVFEKMLLAVRVACDESVRQAKEERDDLINHLEQEKSKILDLSRKLGALLPEEGESTEEFFYGKGQLKTLLDRLATLELTHQNLRAQYKDRSKNVDILIEEMERINECMDREPEEGEFENSGGAEWGGKEGWELSGERVVKLRKRLSKLQALKAERASEMVKLVVDCQKLFRQLGLEVTNPLHSKMLMSLDPSTPEDQPTLRTDEQTQTSVGLSVINVRRLKKMREEMQEELDIHMTQKEEHMRQINVLWNKLGVPQRRREEHLEATKGLTQAVMDKLEAELARLRKLKGKKLTSMMKSTREEIQKLLEAVGAKAEEVLGERARDLSVHPDSWTEELLDRHEEMFSKLETLEKAVSPIMERVRKREDLVLKRERVDSFKMDYRLRGTKFVSQAKEVDDMKKELKRLPQLTADLRKRLTDWQEAEGFPIRYNGREYLKVIEESNMQWQHRKEVNKRSKNSSGKGSGLRIDNHATASKTGEAAATAVAAGAGLRLTGVGGEGGKFSGKAFPSSPRLTKNPLISSFPSSPSRLRHIKLGTFASTGGSQIGNKMVVSQAGEDTAAGAGSKLTVAAGGLGTSVTAIVDGRGEDEKVLGSAYVPPSPKREARNPLLSSFTPSPSRQRHNALAGVFASTGGSHRRQPPPLPARPASAKTSPALGKMQSSPNLLRAVTTSVRGHGNTTATEESRVSSIETPNGLQEPVEAAKHKVVTNVFAPSSGAGSMPPPLPARPARPLSAVFDRADLQAIRESTASSLRSSVSESDLLSGTRLTEPSR